MYDNARRPLLPIFLFLAMAFGCDRSPPSEPQAAAADQLIVGRMVSKLDKFAHSPEQLAAVPHLFAEGSKPSEKDLPRYADYHYESKSTDVNGNTATIAVTVKDAKSQAVVGEMKWTMTAGKYGWLFTDAPLPAK